MPPELVSTVLGAAHGRIWAEQGQDQLCPLERVPWQLCVGGSAGGKRPVRGPQQGCWQEGLPKALGGKWAGIGVSETTREG